jgi:23S rRNA (adenine2503-C2)-methyltransferase
MFAQALRCQWEVRQSPNRAECAPAGGAAALDGSKPNGDRNNPDITHVVIMGMGEPLQNYDNTIAFMKMLRERLNIGYRRITLSTCGIVPGIRRLKDFGEPVNLAISLHAPTDELRARIMPIAEKYKIAETLDAAFDFAGTFGRQLMIEYILLGGVNDAPEHAEQLAALLKGRLCMVNLIPWNTVAERSWTIPSGNAIHRFQDALIRRGVHARIRRERGADIGSACGQLRIGAFGADNRQKPAFISFKSV